MAPVREFRMFAIIACFYHLAYYNVMNKGLADDGLHVIQLHLNLVFFTTAMSYSLYRLVVAIILLSYPRDLTPQLL